MKSPKNLTLLGLSLLCLLISFSCFQPLFTDRGPELTIGTFSDSFWEVQNGYAYRILDDAIQSFETDSGKEIRYESGIIKEEYTQWLCEQFLKEQAPDLFFLLPDDFNQFCELGVLENLDSWIQKEDPDFSRQFYSSAFQYGQYQKKQYALPFECAPKLMFVNQSILDQEGLSLPEEDWSWQDFYSLCERVSRDTNGDGFVDQFGYTGYSWIDAFDSNGVELFSAQGNECDLNTVNVVESLQFLEQLEGLPGQGSSRDFDLGNVLFQPMSFSAFRAYQPYPLSVKKYSNFDWSCIPMPKGPRGDNISSLDCLMIGINTHSSNKEEAWKFLKYLCTDEGIQAEIFQYSEGVSVLRNVTEKDQTLAKLIQSSDGTLSQKILSTAVEEAGVPLRFKQYSRAIEYLDGVINQILHNNLSLETELIIENRRFNQILKNGLLDG